MTDSQENLTEDTRETRRLLREITRAERPEEMEEIKDKILERLNKKTEAIIQLIRERK